MLQDCYFKPEGLLEEELVETICAILWRRRRLLHAERACIQRNIDIEQADDDGTPERIYHQTDLDRLEEVLENVEVHGLDHDAIVVNLEHVYGARDPDRSSRNLFDYYLECIHAFKSPEAESRAKVQADCECKFIAATGKEIGWVQHYLESEALHPQSHASEIKPMRMKMNMFIPDYADMNRLLRYASHLDRELDRAFDQLERAQGRRERQKAIVVPNSLDGQIDKT
jgi:hypothetical protein